MVDHVFLRLTSEFATRWAADNAASCIRSSASPASRTRSRSRSRRLTPRMGRGPARFDGRRITL
jgi:hypothetical protein